MKRLRVLLAVTGALVLTAGAVLAWICFAPFGDPGPHPFNQNRNAVWLEHRWLEKPHPVEEMEELFRMLDGHGVAYAYPHVLPFTVQGTLPAHDREQMRAFLAASRRVAPQMKVLPWIGGVRSGWKRMRAGTIDMANMSQRQQIAAEVRSLVDEGFDGVHLNVEPVDEGNDDFLVLLRALKGAVGEKGILSVSTIHPGPVALPIAPNFLWTPGYYRRVAMYADQIVIMSYDTAIPTAPAYRRYVAWASETMTRTLQDGHARVMIGVPTYDDYGLMHRKGVETLDNALLGVVQGLRGVGGGGTFEGVALYAEWTTDEADWGAYERRWRGRP